MPCRMTGGPDGDRTDRRQAACPQQTPLFLSLYREKNERGLLWVGCLPFCWKCLLSVSDQSFTMRQTA